MRNLFESFRDYQEQNGSFQPEQVVPKKTRAEKQREYSKEYYEKNKVQIKEYQHEYYLKNKQRISKKKSKLQELVYNYYLQNNYEWQIPLDVHETARVLWMPVWKILRATKCLHNKGHLWIDYRGRYYIIDEDARRNTTPISPVSNMFDESEPDLYEDTEIETGESKLEKPLEELIIDLLHSDMSSDNKMMILWIVLKVGTLSPWEKLIFGLFYKWYFK